MYRNNGNTILIIEHKSGVSIANISQSGFEGEILLKSDRTFIIENKTFKPRFDASDPLFKKFNNDEFRARNKVFKGTKGSYRRN